MTAGALADVRVLDLATLYPAPLVAAWLGDFGADVVKVEPPAGDPLRTYGEGPWAVAGRNKRSIILDLETADGLALLARLTAVADVIVVNQPAPVLERWGCDDDALRARNPRAVVVHVSAFGATGPYAERAGNGSLAEAFAGLAGGTGAPLGDTAGALTGVIGVLAALYERDARARGVGQVVDVSLYEAVLPFLAPAIAGQTGAGRMVRDVHVAGDGRRVMVSATTDAHLARLRDCAGDDIGAWVAARSAEDAVTALVAARVPAVEVNDLDTLVRDPHVMVRGSVVATGAHLVPAPTPKLSDSPGEISRTAPRLGDHTAEVVEDWLDGANT